MKLRHAGILADVSFHIWEICLQIFLIWEKNFAASGTLNMEIFIQTNGSKEGPFLLADIKAQMVSGKLSFNDLAWTPGSLDWRAIKDIPEITDFIIPQVPKREQKYGGLIGLTIFLAIFTMISLFALFPMAPAERSFNPPQPDGIHFDYSNSYKREPPLFERIIKSRLAMGIIGIGGCLWTIHAAYKLILKDRKKTSKTP